MNQQLQQAFINYITPERIEQLRLLYGDESQQIENTLEKAFPAVLDGIQAKTSTPDGASYLINTAKDAYDKNILNSISTIFAGGGEWTHVGGRILNNIFPNDGHAVIQGISDTTGAKKSSTHSILIIASLIILALLGKEFAAGKFDRSTLLAFLTGAPVAAALPLAEEPKKKNGWLIPLLILLLLGLLAWWLLKGKSTDAVEASSPTDTTTAVALKPSVVDTVSRTITLPDSNTFHVSKGTMEYKLVAFLNDPNSVPGKDVWFDFDDVNFDFDKATLTSESDIQLNNIASILKAYPSVKVKVGGYTDKKGEESHNMTLSQARADTVLHALLGYGVAQEQLMGAEGYGSQFATQPASASDEERRADRRMSLSVREK